MIESAIIAALKADTALAALVTTYESSPAIFSDDAPESATLPYVTIAVSNNSAVDFVIDEFNLYVDYWGAGSSRANSRSAAFRIECALDGKTFSNTRYANIRCRKFSSGPVQDSDPRDIHYNVQFQVRAGRSAFTAQLT
jgi:hypothetical protein